MQNTPTVNHRITILRGFANQHRAGSDIQLQVSIEALLKHLRPGVMISDALMHAETAFTAAGKAEQARSRINRRIARGPAAQQEAA